MAMPQHIKTNGIKLWIFVALALIASFLGSPTWIAVSFAACAGIYLGRANVYHKMRRDRLRRLMTRAQIMECNRRAAAKVADPRSGVPASDRMIERANELRRRASK